MRLVLDNLGRIEHAEIEIRPLTVFVGENNTNKTWAAYCLYGLARQLIPSSAPGLDYAPLSIEPPDVDAAIDAAVDRTILGVRRDVDVSRLTAARQDLIRDVASGPTFRLSSARIYDLLRLDILPSATAALVSTRDEFTSDKSGLEIEFAAKRRSVSVSHSGPGLALSYAGTVTSASDAEAWSSMLDFARSTLKRLAHGFMGRKHLFVLPAERMALVQTYKLLLGLGVEAAGSRQQGRLFRAPVLEAYMMSPLVDFIHALDIYERGAHLAEPRADAFVRARDELERGVLGGRLDFESIGESSRLSYVPTGGTSFPMHAVSSVVRSLAGLGVYLRWMATAGDLLIIDEPEMNAHPEAQLRIAELLAYLVNHGVHVLITTHSPFIVDHLNNLISAKRLSEAEQAEVAPHFKLKTHEAFLDADDVATYLFQDGGEGTPVTVRSILNREDKLIDWETFGRTSEYLSNLYANEILTRLYGQRRSEG